MHPLDGPTIYNIDGNSCEAYFVSCGASYQNSLNQALEVLSTRSLYSGPLIRTPYDASTSKNHFKGVLAMAQVIDQSDFDDAGYVRLPGALNPSLQRRLRSREDQANADPNVDPNGPDRP